MAAPDSPSIDVDRPCFRCGYNLRGLSGDPLRCPECGTLNPFRMRYTARRHFGLGETRYTITNSTGERVYTFHAYCPFFRTRYYLRDANGRRILAARRRFGFWSDEFDLFRGDEPAGNLSVFWIAWIDDAVKLTLPDPGLPKITGYCALGRCTLRRERVFVAHDRPVQMSWFPKRQITIAAGEDPALLIMAILMLHTARG